MSDQSTNSRIYGIIIGVLLLLSALLGFYLWQKSKSLMAEKERQELEIKQLEKEKKAITRSLDSLSNAYSDLRTENESLTSRIAASAQIVKEKETAIKSMAETSTKELDDLKTQIDALKKAKSEMETIIRVLKEENAQLKGENTRLTEENIQLKTDKDQLTGQVTDLAKQLEEQIRKTQSASFKATSFRVEVLRRDKTTGRARRARDLSINFDLADVPQSFQGVQPLYLVITDENGKPIASVNPIKKTIQAPAGAVEIIAQQSKQVNIGPTQRLNFSYKLEERLKAGNYVVAIYCDKGLLGASSFRVS